MCDIFCLPKVSPTRDEGVSSGALTTAFRRLYNRGGGRGRPSQKFRILLEFPKKVQSTLLQKKVDENR